MAAAGFTQEESKNWSLQKRVLWKKAKLLEEDKKTAPPPPPPHRRCLLLLLLDQMWTGCPLPKETYDNNNNNNNNKNKNKRAHMTSSNSNGSTAMTATRMVATVQVPDGAVLEASTAAVTTAKKLAPTLLLSLLKQTKRIHQVLCASENEQAIRVQFEHAWKEPCANLVQQLKLPANQKGVSRIPATVICDAGRPPVLPETVEDVLAKAITTFAAMTAAQMKDKLDRQMLLPKLTACLNGFNHGLQIGWKSLT
eukprot:jgi/Psemu1/6687/gm1.6687_g